MSESRRVPVVPAPAIGEKRLCLVCAYEKPWGTFDSKTGATVCIDCRDAARLMPSLILHVMGYAYTNIGGPMFHADCSCGWRHSSVSKDENTIAVFDHLTPTLMILTDYGLGKRDSVEPL